MGCQSGDPNESTQQGAGQGVGHPGLAGSIHALGSLPAQRVEEGGGEFGRRGDGRKDGMRGGMKDERRGVKEAGRIGGRGAMMEGPSHWLEICREGG